MEAVVVRRIQIMVLVVENGVHVNVLFEAPVIFIIRILMVCHCNEPVRERMPFSRVSQSVQTLQLLES